jgi:CDP-diacylglycerol pyrophosphatase
VAGVAELAAAVERALALVSAQPGVREAEVFAAANRSLLARLNYISRIPCNGVEEPKSTESRGRGHGSARERDRRLHGHPRLTVAQVSSGRPARWGRSGAIGALMVLVAGCASSAAGPSETAARGAASRDALWRIVSRCVEPASPDYCSRCPSPVAGRCGEHPCSRTTDVWAKTADYVAIRDLKMCGCPAGFVHGLALPRIRITGVDDPRRPAGIWPFAWETARSHILRESEIALAVNPADLRSQDQLHVHLVRLAPGARGRLAGHTAARALALEDVWSAAASGASAAGLADYGVLVTRDGDGPGYLVTVIAGSPEYAFTLSTCR